MKYFKQFGIILIISFIGEILNAVIPLPVPASIYGLVIMLSGLCSGVIKIESVKETSMFLIEIMPIMFIPSAVGLITVWKIIKPSIWSYAAITVLSTFIVMAVAGCVTQLIIRRRKKTQTAEGSVENG